MREIEPEPDPDLRSYEEDNPSWRLIVLMLAIVAGAMVGMLWAVRPHVVVSEGEEAIAEYLAEDPPLPTCDGEIMLCYITVTAPWTQMYPKYRGRDTLLARIDIDSLVTELTIIDSRSDTSIIALDPPVRLEVRTR